MTFVQEPGQATTSGRQNDKGKAPAFQAEVLPHEAQSEGENENERLLLFSDGIIAFTITLATISIRLPVGRDYTTPSAFFADLGPYLITYLIGFVIVGSYWFEHWRFFRYIKHSSTALVVRNLLFLASGILLLIVWMYASRKHRLIYEDVSAALVRNTTLRLLRNPFAIIIYLVAFVVLGDSITGSVLPVIVFLVIWEGMRRFLNRNTTTTKPTDTRRVAIFSDCVMAIAITLVAAQLELPELKFGSGVDHALTESAAEHLTLILLLYLVAFLNIGIHWMSHYHMFRSIKRSNTWLVVINFAFLLCITLLFLPTTASIEYPGLFTSRFYYIAQTITAFLLVLMWIYAVQKKRMLDEEADPARIRRTTARLVRNLLIFAGLALLTLVFSMQIDILAYFWIYLLVEFVVYVIRRTQRFVLHRKLPKPEKGNMASIKK